MNIWQALLGSGISSTVLALVFLLYTFIKKKRDSNSIKNESTNKNSINISSNNDHSINLLNDGIKDTRKMLRKLSEDVKQVSWDLERLSIALNYYVDNNGVSDEVKKHFKNILEEGKK